MIKTDNTVKFCCFVAYKYQYRFSYKWIITRRLFDNKINEENPNINEEEKIEWFKYRYKFGV